MIINPFFVYLEKFIQWNKKQSKIYLFWFYSMNISALIGGMLLKDNFRIAMIFIGIAFGIWAIGWYPIARYEEGRKKKNAQTDK